MVDLAYTPAELENKKKMMDSPEVGDMDKYPWGTRLRLDNDTVKKIGYTPGAVGTEVMIMAKAKVVEVEAREEADGDTKHHVSLQMIDMNIQGEGLSNAQTASALYGNKQEDK